MQREAAVGVAVGVGGGAAREALREQRRDALLPREREVCGTAVLERIADTALARRTAHREGWQCATRDGVRILLGTIGTQLHGALVLAKGGGRNP